MLVVGVAGHRVALPLSSVRETMRPLPLERLRDAPAFTLGLSVIRGLSVPVVDLGALLGRGAADARFGRFVTLAVDERLVALAVESVEGVVGISAGELAAVPPLLERAAGGAVEAISLHDQALLLVLRATRVFSSSAAFEVKS